ncbi:hypothetical protein LCGC14_2420340, partial [marine sediment metagenome]
MGKAKVVLISHTENPIVLACYARRIMHSKIPDSLEELEKSQEQYLGMTIDEYFNKVLMKDHMPTFLEFISFTFKLENVSRAMVFQLVRHRIGFSYSQQSLRCVNLPNFADDKAYYNPYREGTVDHNEYHHYMVKAQERYRAALKAGMPTQNARGILPLNIHTTITFSCTLRALIGMVNKRLCFKTQEEFKGVAAEIVKLVKSVDERLGLFFHKPCAFGKCMMEAENEQQLEQKKFKGKQNTQYVC